jgi:hydrogenase maturation protease
MQAPILVAGVGNIFLGDDGFGVEVVKRLGAKTLPEWVRVADFGIKSIHLAYELLDHKYATTIIVDAAPRGSEPGTVYLIEPDLLTIDNGFPDAHGITPQAVFALLKSLGGAPGKVYIVGCEPARVEEYMSLSEPVARAVEEAVNLIMNIVGRGIEAKATRRHRG